MIIGIGTPKSQSRTPRPIAASIVSWTSNALLRAEFRLIAIARNECDDAIQFCFRVTLDRLAFARDDGGGNERGGLDPTNARCLASRSMAPPALSHRPFAGVRSSEGRVNG